jgi:hypothetical protein
MSNIDKIFGGLHRRILRRIENDFNDSRPFGDTEWYDILYKKVRRSVLDEINEQMRTAKLED